MPARAVRTLHEGSYVDCVRWLGPGGALASKATDDCVLVWAAPDLAAGDATCRGAADVLAAAPPLVPEVALAAIAARRAELAAGSADAAASAAAAAAHPPVSPTPPPRAPRSRRPRASGAPGAPPADTRLLARLATPGAGKVWFLRFDVDAAATLLAVGDIHGRVWLFDPRRAGSSPASEKSGATAAAAVLQSDAAAAGLPAPPPADCIIVRQTAVNASGSILLAAREDGTLWRWDRVQGPPRGGRARVG